MRVVRGEADTSSLLPRLPVSRLVGHDGPISLVRFTGEYDTLLNEQRLNPEFVSSSFANDEEYFCAWTDACII